MYEIEAQLLPICTWSEDSDLKHDELINLAMEIIDKHLENKEFK